MAALHAYCTSAAFPDSLLSSSYLRGDGPDVAALDSDEVLHLSNAAAMDTVAKVEALNSKVLPTEVTEQEVHSLDAKIFEEKARQMLLSKDTFLFEYGVVVLLWGLSVEEEQDVLESVRAFAMNPVDSEDFEEAADELQFVYHPVKRKEKRVQMDRMRLRTIGTSAPRETRPELRHCTEQQTLHPRVQGSAPPGGNQPHVERAGTRAASHTTSTT